MLVIYPKLYQYEYMMSIQWKNRICCYSLYDQINSMRSFKLIVKVRVQSSNRTCDKTYSLCKDYFFFNEYA